MAYGDESKAMTGQELKDHLTAHHGVDAQAFYSDEVADRDLHYQAHLSGWNHPANHTHGPRWGLS